MFPTSLLCAILGVMVPHLVCQETPELVVFITDIGSANASGAIHKLHLHHMIVTTLNIPNVVAPMAIDVDQQQNHIYWTDINTRQIRRADINGGNDVIVANLNSTSSPEGLTLDAKSRQVFYTDQGNNIIVRIEMSNFQSEVIVNTGLDHPKGIVADTSYRKLFWVDFGNDTKIESSDYDGNQRQLLVSSNLFGPSGITLDQRTNRIFWTDQSGLIESIHVDGTDRTRLRKSTLLKFNDIAVFNDFLYYTSLRNRYIYVLTEAGNHSSYITANSLHDPTGLCVFSPKIDATVTCPYGKFGSSCENCGNCKDGWPCEKTTGVCLSECASGFKPDYCTEACDSGTFGEDCKLLCSSKCSGSICDPVTGHCLNGCTSGWTGVNCTLCAPRTYGDCLPCGRCAGGASCNSVSGYCDSGCEPGWTGYRCDTEAPTGDNKTTEPSIEAPTGDNKTTGPSIGLIVGVVVAITVVIISVVVIVVVIVRKQRKTQDRSYVGFENRNENSAYATIGKVNTTDVCSEQPKQTGTLGDAFS